MLRESEVTPEVAAILDRYPTTSEIPTIAEIHVLFSQFGTVVPMERTRFQVQLPSGEVWNFQGRITAWDWYYASFVNRVRNPW
jgi:hypothetical protein